ncbi:MAG: Gfo/Idh/MocA family oxidoreductase [Opitutaceae bacterium]|jgi:predicted dehydrogenase|nr:Gfo/Idh/MocA family oxidoreductase [Opitutaceae bacterium]
MSTEHASDGPEPVGVALYGANGHQIHALLATRRATARLVAVAEFPPERLPPGLRGRDGARACRDLDELLADPRVELVSLCSPRRRDQARDAIRALRAGKHVYAEKPCAFSEPELDAILAAAREGGGMFREMAGTAFAQPYLEMRRVVRSGALGRVIQVVAEKSYPWHDGRPQDEDIDGGLVRQCAIHALRFVEHVAGERITSASAIETRAGNPVPGGGSRVAACLMLGLASGGVASIAANYLNPEGAGVWGYETLRILGDQGMVESAQGGARTRLVVGGRDFGPLDVTRPGIEYLDAFIARIRGRGDLPLTSEEELSPTRWAIRAKQTL